MLLEVKVDGTSATKRLMRSLDNSWAALDEVRWTITRLLSSSMLVLDINPVNDSTVSCSL